MRCWSAVCRGNVVMLVSLAVGLAPALSFAAVAPTLQDTSTREVTARLEGLFATMEAALELIPRSELDPSALASTLGNDVAVHLQWVRDETDWIPYAGALRGPRGVLADRVGNSLDRSLLLAELLESAGFSVRLRRAVLTTTTAAHMLDAVRPTRFASAPVASQSQEFTTRVLEIAAIQGVDVKKLTARIDAEERAAEALQATLEERVEEQAAFLLAAVAPHRRPVADGQAERLEAARDHWWVQARIGRNWVDLDPMLPDAVVGEAPVPNGRTVSYSKRNGVTQLPRGTAHEVEIRVIVEQSRAGRLREREALRHVLLPYALNGRPVSLAIAASHAGEDGNGLGAVEAEIRRRAAEPGEWVFALQVGEDVVPGRAMLADGSVTTPDMSPGRNRQRLGGALDRLNLLERAAGGSSDRDDTFASAVWIEFELRIPGRDAAVVRRPLFDLLAATRHLGNTLPDSITAAQRLEREAALTQGTDVLVLGATLHPDVVADRLMRRMLAMREAMLAIVSDPTRETLAARAAAIETPALPMDLYTLASQRLAAGPGGLYIDSPNVLAYKRGYRFADDGAIRAYFGFDIVANGVGVEAPDAFAARLRQGVVDTNLEALLLDGGMQGSGTANRLAGSADPTKDWIVLTESQDAPWSDEPAAARLHALVAADLEAGRAVVVPRVSTGEPVWWQIDLETGHTLGLAAGGGQSLAEQGILLRITIGILQHWRLLPCLFTAQAGLAVTTGGCTVLGLASIYGTLPFGYAMIPFVIASAGLEYLLIVMHGHGLL